ncbi:serine/threonine-protein kinase LATS1 isoform X1 [Alosa sapidissima]|uniref:serine/threonine-protein kinase LATS1 isoform X1 n=1 Tax=Alosa sapidissima TaxID=34773 RepID=UPI001C0909E7|nr:serine/threonine-protein kinase LATS1 isoform X1 [Alosa sapidissima]XP_041950998.1 serine/threonine-protein kinase LATS1 isoform X1 [Alosa sapidissima]
MKRGEKPEGYRQMRPKTFPASNYSGNSEHMLQEIRESLRNLPRPSDGLKVDMVAVDTRQQGRSGNPKNPYYKALQEIRKSLKPFEYESTSDVNKQMKLQLISAGFEEEMAVRALKQTNSRSIEAAIEYISKMSYQDPIREQMVMVAAAARPINAGMKGPGGAHIQQPVLRKPSWKGSKESLAPHRHGPVMVDAGMMYRSSSPGPQGGDMSGRPPPTPSGFQQAHLGGGQRVNPPLPPQMRSVTPPPNRGTTPPPSSWDANPSTKRFSGNMDYLGPRISPVPQTGWSEGYPAAPPPPSQNQRGISPVPVGRQPIIMPSSAGNKFTFPPCWPQNGNPAQSDYMGHQNMAMSSGNRQPPPPYPMNPSNRQSPTALQMQAGGGGPAPSPPYVNGGNLPQSMLVPNRNSHNLDMYNLQPWAQAPPHSSGQQQASSAGGSGQDLAPPPSWASHNVPVRSNSFTSPQMVGSRGQGAPSSSQPSATTVTAITQAPILQPVKSMRVQKPELHTAVAPTHPPWIQQQQQQQQQQQPLPPPPPSPYQETSASGGGGPPQMTMVAEAPSYQGPPPPYPKHLLQQQPSAPCPTCEPGSKQGAAGPEEATAAADDDQGSSSSSAERERETSEAPGGGGGGEGEKKQITTSPVPVRRNKRDEERRGEVRVPIYSPQAFKFFMEQHVENILKNYQHRIRRKKQLESEMQRVGLSGDAQEQMRMMLSQKESNYIRLKRAKMDKSMFVKIKTLGVGAFGEVCLARKVDTGALYAMKTLRKKDVLLRNQVAHVKAERDILAEADNEWVVRLYYSFQDKDSLYFVMDYIPGGDMMSLLIRLGIFEEELARFYIAELTCAVESVHKMGFIHRDIKPDNILIDRDGHIKLTDFGLCTGFRWTHDSKYYQSGDHVRQDSMDFSKEWEDSANCRCGDRLKPLERRAARQHQRCLAHSLVGTPNYIAPEVLLRTGYTQLCDWWSVGVILYEMLVGQPPFLATTPLETQVKVINWQTTLHIPPQAKLSPEASDLIVKLCRGPDDRLGKNGADEIKAHPFFRSVDFSTDLRQQQQPAPYVPKITHSTDTSNFDPVDPDKLWSSTGGGDGTDADGNRNDDTLNGWFRNGKHPEHAFYEFTFRRFFDDNGYPYSCPKPIEYEEEGDEGEEGDAEATEQEVVAQAVPGRDLVYV